MDVCVMLMPRRHLQCESSIPSVSVRLFLPPIVLVSDFYVSLSNFHLTSCDSFFPSG